MSCSGSTKLLTTLARDPSRNVRWTISLRDRTRQRLAHRRPMQVMFLGELADRQLADPPVSPGLLEPGSTLDRATCDLHADDTNVKLRIRVGPTPGEQEPHLDGAKPTASALVVVRVCHFCSACLPRASGLR